MASKRVDIRDYIATRIRTLSGLSRAVATYASAPQQISQRPWVEVLLGGEARQQLPARQTERTLEVRVNVWGAYRQEAAIEDICESIENVLRDDISLGGLVRSQYATDRLSDEGALAMEQMGCVQTVILQVNYREDER